MICPMTEESTGNEIRLDEGIYLDKWGQGSVQPIKMARGKITIMSTQRYSKLLKFDKAPCKTVTPPNWIIEYKAMYLKHWKLVVNAHRPSLFKYVILRVIKKNVKNDIHKKLMKK